MKKVYFYRNFKRFTGGHLKVWDYFNHIKMTANFTPFIYMESGGDVSDNNPWLSSAQNKLPEWSPLEADVLFLAGMDWFTLPYPERKKWPKPVINLIQGFRHSIPDTPLYDCLSNHAIRICVSQEVANSILATGKVNGPVFTIPNGIDYSFINNIKPNGSKEFDLLIVGLKNPNMAKELEIACKKLPITIKCLTEIKPRLDFIRAMAASRIAVLLPSVTEGFYLPAIEAMALGTIVICPDCIGNRSFCINGDNCLVPTYTLDGIFEAVNTVTIMNSNGLNRIRNSAIAVSKLHNLENERQSFFDILNLTSKIWKQI
jgi:glycosyltransferase involved in cell wall biosynthesis